MEGKIDLTKIASIGGLVLTIVGTVVGNWAHNRTMHAEIIEEVAKVVNK